MVGVININRLIVKTFGTTYVINYKHIVFFESNYRKINIILCDNNIITYYDNFTNLKLKIDMNQFIQSHKSYIVDYEYIYMIEKDEISFTRSKRCAYISKGYRKQFFKKLYSKT